MRGPGAVFLKSAPGRRRQGNNLPGTLSFPNRFYIKNKEDAVKIGKKAKKSGIKLSIHAPYWINLNSKDKKKIEQSKQRILKSCEIGHY